MRFLRRVALIVLLVGPGVVLGWLLRVESGGENQERRGVQGEVRAQEGPVSGALVRLKGTATWTHTDLQGRFQLPFLDVNRRITASRSGYFIAGSRAEAGPVRLHLGPLPAEDNPDYEWVDPSPDSAREHACGNCHAEIFREWSASAHARSASGRRFRNLYEGTSWTGEKKVSWGLLDEHPAGSAVCAACHAPGTADSAVDMREVAGVDRHGVHCDYCHKISGTGNGQMGLNFGRFNLQLLRPTQGQLFFGPLDDVDRNEDTFSPLYRDSRYCASCHEGMVFGVPVYTTYSEWLASPARKRGQQCQHCHTTPTGKMTNIAPGHGGIERNPTTLGNHSFFQPSQEAMLRRCLHLEVQTQTTAVGQQVQIQVRVDEVGHRVPTGFSDRHLVLVVEGILANGKRVDALSGPRLPPEVGAELVGQAGKLYAKKLHDEKGQSPVPFWRAEPEAEDNRLTPGECDRLTVVFPQSVVRVRARVLYRRFWIEVARAKGWPEEDLLVAEVVRSTGMQR